MGSSWPPSWILRTLSHRATPCLATVERWVSAASSRPGLEHPPRDSPDDPNPAEFASWAPSSVCFYFTDAVQVGRRRVVEKDARRYQMIAAWILGTKEPKTGGRRDIVVDMYASRSTLRRAAEAARVRLEDAHSVVDDRADTTFDIYNVKLERTVLAWHGRPTGDSTRVERPIQESWSVPGLRAGAWTARLAMSPMWSRPLVGSLTVQGKGDLAMALKASPIRFVGPLYRGGGGELRLSR